MGQVAEGDGELEQGERVSQGSVEQPPPDARCHHGIPAGKQCCRRFIRQRLHPHDGQVSLVEEAGLAGPAGGEQAHRQAGETAGHHAEHECARAVKPRQVVDDQEQRLFLGRQLQESKDRAGEEELRWRLSLAQAERHVQGPGERRGQPGRLVEAGEQELVEGGIGEVRLELRAGRPQQPDP